MEQGGGQAAAIASLEEANTATRQLKQVARNNAKASAALLRGRRAVAVPASEVRMRPVEWLWPGRIPAGEVTILAGDPGLGKSLLTVRLAAELTRGGLGEAGNALLLTAEDSSEHTVRPRLEAAGAVLERVSFGWIEREGLQSPLLFPADAGELHALVARHGAELVVIDPLSGHLERQVNSWKDQEVRTALAPLRALANETGAAIVIVAHLNKGQGSNPLQRLGGSIGIPAAARSVLLLARDPDDPDGDHGSKRALAHVKCNLAAQAPSLRYEIEATAVMEGLATARIVERGQSPYTGSELLAVSHPSRGLKREEAIDFLQRELADGPRKVRELQQLARECGIAEQTLKRAKETLNVKSEKLDFVGAWAWILPPANGEEEADE